MEHKQFEELKQLTERQLARIAEEAGTSVAELKLRVLELEQKGTARGGSFASVETAGDIFVKSDNYNHAIKQPSPRFVEAVSVGSFFSKAALIGTGSPLVPAQNIPVIVRAADQQVLSVRGLFSVGGCSSNLVQFPRETSDDSDVQGAVQYSSPNFENVQKREISMTFELADAPVRTIAAFIPASRQILADAPLLASYINSRLIYGVLLAEEDQVLNGTGTGADLTGLVTVAQAYSGATTGDNMLDTLIRATAQVNNVGGVYAATGVVLNPADITALLLLKDGEGRYIVDTLAQLEAKLGVRIASSKQMAAGSWLVGDFQRGAQLLDREQSTIRVAEQHADFFTKNMVAVLGEERIALPIYSEMAFVTGSF